MFTGTLSKVVDLIMPRSQVMGFYFINRVS